MGGIVRRGVKFTGQPFENLLVQGSFFFSASMFVLGGCKFNFVELKTTFLFQIGPD